MDNIEKLWLICGQYNIGGGATKKYVSYFFGTRDAAIDEVGNLPAIGSYFLCPVNHSIEIQAKNETISD